MIYIATSDAQASARNYVAPLILPLLFTYIASSSNTDPLIVLSADFFWFFIVADSTSTNDLGSYESKSILPYSIL